MKNLIILLLFSLFYCCNININDPTQIVDKQEDISNKIKNNEDFDIDKTIKSLENQLFINFCREINPVSSNNIAVRNCLLLSTLYYMKSDKDKFLSYRDTALIYIKYNLVNDSIWSEGPSYYLYVEDILDTYLKVIGNDKELETFKQNCNGWFNKYIMPDGSLPPIGDTRRDKDKFGYNHTNGVIFDSEETMFKIGDLNVFVRHPTLLNHRLNDHVHYDIGDICVYKGNECIIYPVGYPGSDIKAQYGLNDLKYKNALYYGDLEKWRSKKYRQVKVERTDSSIYIEYEIDGSLIISRRISIDNGEITIEDKNSNGINLNFDKNYELEYQGEIENGFGLHCENGSDVVKNKRVLVYSKTRETKVILKTN